MNRFVAYFDLDGCLIDSRTVIASCIDYALRKRGLAGLEAGEVDGSIGPPIDTVFRLLLNVRGIVALESSVSLVASFRSRYERVSRAETKLFPGIATMIERLSEHATLVVVTSKAQYLADPLLVALGVRKHFAAVYGPDRDALSETKHQTLHRALGAFARTDHDAMIGDRRQDIEAGRSLGLRTIGVTWGSGSRCELEDAGATMIVDEPSSLACALGVPHG